MIATKQGYKFMNSITLNLIMAAFGMAIIASCKPAVTDKTNSAVNDEKKEFDRFLDSLHRLAISDYEIADQIRKYLSARLNRKMPDDSISIYYNQAPFENMAPFECLSLMQSGSLVGNCGLSSSLLAKLYVHAGYAAYIYNCGFENSRFTHQFNLLKIEDNLIVQDAHYNMTIRAPDGGPKDFIQILSEIKANDFSKMVIDEDELLKGGKKTNFSIIARERLEWMAPLVEAHNLPANFLSIYLKPLSVMDARSGSNAVELEEKLLPTCRN